MFYFTKTAHFVGVSSMSFRMKRIYGGGRNEDITKTKRKQEDFVKYLPVFSKADY